MGPSLKRFICFFTALEILIQGRGNIKEKGGGWAGADRGVDGNILSSQTMSSPLCTLGVSVRAIFSTKKEHLFPGALVSK